VSRSPLPFHLRAVVVALATTLAVAGSASGAEPLPNCGDTDRHFDPNEIPAAPVGPGAVFYVDAANGSDSNNGTSEQTAFKTIGRAVNNSAAPIGPGSTVRIKAGRYRERLNITKSGTASQRIVVGAYGNGPVVVDGSTAVTGWTQASGQIYKTTPGFKVRAVVVDEEPLFPEKSQGALVESRWYFDGTTLYVWCPGGGSPAVHDVGVVADSEYENTIYLNPSSYITLYGLTVRFSGGNAINVWGANVRIEKCRVIFAGKTGISLFNYGSINTDNAEIIKNELYHNFLRNWPRGGEYKNGGWGMGATSNGTTNALFQGNVSHKNGGEGLGGYAGQGGTIYRDNVVYDNWSVNIYVDNQPNVVVENNFIYSHQPDPGDLYNNGDTAPGDGQNLKRLRPEGIVTADENYGSGANLRNVTIRNNVIVNCRRGYNHFADVTGSALKNVKILGNTIVVPQDLIAGEQVISGMIIPWNKDRAGTNTGSLIEDNVVYATNPDTDLLHREDGPTSGDSFAGTTFSNNAWHHTSRSKPFHWGSSYNPQYDFDHASWAALAGTVHASGDVANPMLIDPDTVEDVDSKAPSNGSPAIDGGTSTGVAYDYDFCPRPQGGLYDIGAFEGAGGPAFRIGDASVTEGNAGTTNAAFSVRLTPAATGTTTVHYATGDGTAKAGTDYTAASGDLTFPAGQTNQTVTVGVIANLVVDGTRTFSVTLSGAVGADIAHASGVGTIHDDDVPPQILQFSAASYKVSEALASAAVSVRRSAGKTGTIIVEYATVGGSAAAGVDYAPVAGALTFGPGVLARTIRVPILRDVAPEGSETVLLSLRNPSPGAALGPQHTTALTILDNDRMPTVQLGARVYGVAEAAGAARITVRRTGDSSAPASVVFTATGGTAVAGVDFTPLTTTVSFPPGVSSQVVQVPILHNSVGGANRTVVLALGSPQGALVGSVSSAVLTIVNNDAALQFSAAAYSVSERTRRATITVRRTGSAATAATVSYATSNGTATANADYAPATGILAFAPHVSSRSFTVDILDDTLDEGSETLNLTLSGATGASLAAPSTAVLTILDDETTVQLSASAYKVSESLKKATIFVRRTGSTSGTTTVHYATSNGTATAGSDYTAISGTLTFAPRVRSLSLAIPLVSDSIDEPDETVNLTLSSPSGAKLGTPATAMLTIRDNDKAGTIQLGAPAFSVGEADGAATITLTRSGGAAAATVSFTTAAGSALAGTDYVAVSTTVSFAAGETSKTVLVPIVDDIVAEPAKYLTLTLGSPSYGVALGSQSSVALWIVDND
jgi:Calx-beta domain/Right handed beta helix region